MHGGDGDVERIDQRLLREVTDPNQFYGQCARIARGREKGRLTEDRKPLSRRFRVSGRRLIEDELGAVEIELSPCGPPIA